MLHGTCRIHRILRLYRINIYDIVKYLNHGYFEFSGAASLNSNWDTSHLAMEAEEVDQPSNIQIRNLPQMGNEFRSKQL